MDNIFPLLVMEFRGDLNTRQGKIAKLKKLSKGSSFDLDQEARKEGIQLTTAEKRQIIN